MDLEQRNSKENEMTLIDGMPAPGSTSPARPVPSATSKPLPMLPAGSWQGSCFRKCSSWISTRLHLRHTPPDSA